MGIYSTILTEAPLSVWDNNHLTWNLTELADDTAGITVDSRKSKILQETFTEIFPEVLRGHV